jgi:hypothetical protein
MVTTHDTMAAHDAMISHNTTTAHDAMTSHNTTTAHWHDATTKEGPVVQL